MSIARDSGCWRSSGEFEPDVVHLNGYAHGSLPFSSPVLMVGHSCVLSWWEACRAGAAPGEWDTYSWRVRSGLQGADLVVAPTHAMLTALHRHYGPLSKTRVIPNGRSAQLYRADCRREPLILSAGRLWDEAKNVEALHAIAREVSWPIVIAGDDCHPQGGRVQAGAATLLGKLDEISLAHWYARAAIYALPARYEPFGLSVLEAALSGCALVLGDIPSLRENWEGAAEFVRPDDSDHLRQSLLRLMDDPGYRHELIQRSTQRSRRFSVESFASAYFSAYQEIATLGQPSDRSTFACAS